MKIKRNCITNISPMNIYKEYLDELIRKIEFYKFMVRKLEKLIQQDVDQLNAGGDFFDISAVYIRDWANFTNADWQIDYRRLAVTSKQDYLLEIDAIKTSIYKHYFIQSYEDLISFIVKTVSIKKENGRSINITDILKKIDTDTHNQKTPFGFKWITFLYSFCKVRNSFVHNNDIFSTTGLLKKNGIELFNVTEFEIVSFVKGYLTLAEINDNCFKLSLSKQQFQNQMEFTKSYSFELYKFYSEKNGLEWKIVESPERLDIKTGKPLTLEQKGIFEKTINRG